MAHVEEAWNWYDSIFWSYRAVYLSMKYTVLLTIVELIKVMAYDAMTA